MKTENTQSQIENSSTSLLRVIFNLLTPADRILIFLALTISISSIFLLKGFALQKEGDMVIVEVGGAVVKTLPLNRNDIIDINNGKNVIEIKDGRVRMLRATCRDKICVKQGWIKNSGEAIICVPNRVIVRIEGIKDNSLYDAITG
ncbi:MAG: NusG domain II-containing protein [Nitrospirota bacterium]